MNVAHHPNQQTSCYNKQVKKKKNCLKVSRRKIIFHRHSFYQGKAQKNISFSCGELMALEIVFVYKIFAAWNLFQWYIIFTLDESFKWNSKINRKIWFSAFKRFSSWQLEKWRKTLHEKLKWNSLEDTECENRRREMEM